MLYDAMFLFGASDASGAASGQVSSVPMFVTLGLMFLVMYMFLIRPQSKKQKAMREMVKNLKNGDKIITIGGLHGTIVNLKEKTVVLKVDDNTTLEFSRESISTVLADNSNANVSEKTDKSDKTTAKEQNKAD